MTLSKNWAMSDTHVNKIAPCSHQWLTTSHHITILPSYWIMSPKGRNKRHNRLLHSFHYSYEDILTLRLLSRHAHEV